MKVLAVEDDPVGLMGISGALKSLGHEVITATNGFEGLKAAHREKIRLVVSDWRMPLLDGLDFCRALRRQTGDYIYFILLTVAESNDANADEALAAGVDDFLNKPLSLRELKSRLHVAERILGFTTQVRQ